MTANFLGKLYTIIPKPEVRAFWGDSSKGDLGWGRYNLPQMFKIHFFTKRAHLVSDIKGSVALISWAQ